MSSLKHCLNSFVIRIPGGSDDIKLTDTEELQRQLLNHHGDWKTSGRVTPIPLVRIPPVSVFLEEDQLPDFCKKRFARNRAGEKGEVDVFKQVERLTGLCGGGNGGCGSSGIGNGGSGSSGIGNGGGGSGIGNGGGDSHPNTNIGHEAKIQTALGMAAFPNVDSRCFKDLRSHVEIDLVLLHPQKGIFLFNVKNQKNGLDAAKIVGDVKRHANFLRQLCQAPETTPINAVVCSVSSPIHPGTEKAIREPLQEFSGDCFFFHTNGIQDSKTFIAKWKGIFDQIEELGSELKTQVMLIIVVVGVVVCSNRHPPGPMIMVSC